MKRYPCLEINLNKVYKNTKEIVDRLRSRNINVTAVTKCTGGNLEVAQTFQDAGVYALGDSRIDNLKRFKDLKVEKWLIRIPMKSEAEEAVLYSDLSLNSEVEILEALDYWAKVYKKKHKVILMIDHGDLREGWFDLDQLKYDLKKIKRLENINVVGIGTNSNCAGAIIPEPDTFKKFPEIIDEIKSCFKLKNIIVSGGNSGTYYMVEDDTIPSFINNLRLGELLLFGHETSYQKAYDYLDQDIFTLEAEVIEIKEKPSVPIGNSGVDAFGKKPKFIDKGIRKRAILAIGKQDIPPEDLIPRDKNISIVTASSDHLIIDITDSKENYYIGSIIPFNCTYSSALRASTSDYVNKTVKR